MARYWREVWADAVAKLPPSWSTPSSDTRDANDALTGEPITAGGATGDLMEAGSTLPGAEAPRGRIAWAAGYWQTCG